MPSISFVILQYNTYELTIQCIESIHNNLKYEDYSIIVVNNHSKSDAAAKIKEYCIHDTNTYILEAPSNLGFAKGNNLGYSYAVSTLHADYVICVNNDTEFTQPDFLNKMLALHEQSHAAIIGPDIVTPEHIHQSPYRLHALTCSQVVSWRRKRFLWTIFLVLDQWLNLRKRSRHIGAYVARRNQAAPSGVDSSRSYSDVVLQGACLIFTPEFIKTFDYAFYPETFLYCEEDIIFTLCSKKGLHTLYSPELCLLHKDGQTARSLGNKPVEKEIFESKHITKSLKVLKKVMKANL